MVSVLVCLSLSNSDVYNLCQAGPCSEYVSLLLDNIELAMAQIHSRLPSFLYTHLTGKEKADQL